MGTQIRSLVFEDAEKWLTANLHDLLADPICNIERKKNERPCTYTYRDVENHEATPKVLDMMGHIVALQLLCDLVLGPEPKLFVGGIKSAADLIEPCNWDAEVVDAYRQLCFYGEIIYG